MADSDSLGYWIRRRRKALDLTQRELADEIPCSLATIKKIETDARRPSSQMAERLAVCLSLPADEAERFVAVAQGQRPVNFLTLAETPAPQLPPIDRLPPSGTPFIGREAELGAVAALLDSPDMHLLTILGPGGMGKTRLAMAAAEAQRTRQPRRFGEGVVFVELAPVLDASFVAPAIAAMLGVDLAERRGDSRSPVQKLLDFLAPRRLLLILDNFEHLLAGGSAALVPAMLAAAPGLTILVTSRLRLNLREEHLYALSGIGYRSEPGQSFDTESPLSPAAELFLISARRQRPDFSLRSGEAAILAGICQRIEGMPLALELAASWVDSLSLGGIADELGSGIDFLASDLTDMPERHRSIRSTLEGSWRLLEHGERQAFMRLSVFRGGFTRTAAVKVANAELPTLARLISKSLLAFDASSERYRVHEVLRQHGQEKLEQSGALAETRLRHLAYFIALAEAATGKLFGPEQITWLDALDAEGDNIRAALEWSVVQPDRAGDAANLAIGLGWFWRIRSRVQEGSEWLGKCLLLPGLTTGQRASLLYHAGHMAWMQDDLALAGQREEESVALWQSLGDDGRRGAAYALHTLGMARYSAAFFTGDDVAPAIETFQASLVLMHEAGDEWGAAFVEGWIIRCRLAQEETTPAFIDLAQDNVAVHQRLGDVWGTGMAIGMLASLSLQAGDLAAARAYAEQAQELRTQVGHRHSMAVGWELLADIAEAENKPNEVATAYHEAIAILESLGNRPYADDVRIKLAALGGG